MFKYILLVFFCSHILYGFSQSRKERRQLFDSTTNYEVQMLGVGQDGTKVFKIWAFGKKPDEAIMHAKQLAVRACLFKGLPGSGETNETPAICDTGAETTYADFFESFFTVGGAYLNYVNMTTDGIPSGQDRLKIKGGYKIGLKVQVLYNNLRKAMETEGIAKRLDSIS
ncbi:MAG: hypothetical protein LUH01_06140 [Parabacteroides gordonii]|nr:hypothetical protein [Parabacteroides gordonii]